MSFAGFGYAMLGKLATNLSDTYGTGDTLREHQRKEAESDYLARERQGIVARVEGAKAAGLHPLVAMNYQGGNSPSAIIGGSAPPVYPGGPDREPVAQERDPNIDRYNAARARLAEAEATKAELDLARSQRALATQPGQPIPVLPTSPANFSTGGLTLKPGVTLKPDEVTAGVGGLTAGTHPGVTDFEMPWGSTWSLPSDKLSQALEDLEFAKYYAILRANAPRLWQEFVSQFPTSESKREIESLRKRYPPRGTPGKWPPRMHGGQVDWKGK
ncbi:DNA pilot protein [Apis mellifera associated microvirus 47]|nr:DNA pilot protein [Apis mellifera associated microvirus 47]